MNAGTVQRLSTSSPAKSSAPSSSASCSTARRAESRPRRRRRRRAAGRSQHRPGLREALDPDADLLRGRRRRAGRDPVVLRGDELQLSRGESVADTARVLSRYVDAIVIRSGSHEAVAELAARGRGPGRQRAHPAAPPLPGARRPAHPARALRRPRRPAARLRRRRQQRRPLAGDRSASWPGSRWSSRRRAGYQLEEGHGAKLTDDPRAAAAGADALYTDVWVSMGDEAEAERRRADLAPFRLDADLLAAAKDERDRPPLPARPPRRGDHRRGPLRRALRRLGPGREPPARAEGAAGDAARSSRT